MPTQPNSIGPFPGPDFGLENGRSPIDVVASAATITLQSAITRITGNTTIDTINRPTLHWCGPVYLFNTDSSVGTISTSGNVQLGVTLTRYKLFLLLWDPATSKWYPSAVS